MANLGRMQVGAYDRDIGRPLPNAKVMIFDPVDNREVEELITDDSGQTLYANLDCPPMEYSLEPEAPKPYAEYTVVVQAEGYEPYSAQGVEIFDGTLCYQQANLIRTNSPANLPEQILIPEHTLWGIYPPKIPEDPVKPINPETGYVVLDKPVIPETIVVHNGSPDDNSAKNYYVPFKDYIKNVACCEIYATWPESTLRANILAIISFTLNRVYTEWYRNKGKNFTITNNTAYDQAFSYGRNIFTEISEVVDSIFNTYIAKPDVKQPLFTQYCDGQRSTCPNWLSQWGSKNLGDQGLDSVAILKNYYGPDVYLSQAEKVAGIPMSYPGTPLQVGSTGQDVRTIQQQLNTISNNYPAIKKVKVDGVYGNETLLAVETFQGIFKLPTSGIVDFATWYKISEIYVAVTKIAELV